MGFAQPPKHHEVTEHQRVTPKTWPGKIHDVEVELDVEIDPKPSEPMGYGLLSLGLGSLLLVGAVTWHAIGTGDHELLKIILGIAGGGLWGSVLGKVRVSLRNNPKEVV